ncbi:MAG: biotin/lipoyl-containing protein [Candidatus Dojkabacteria bacterium]|nr:MAG: biotin/lipoyl-containing protein [Candidatus Dojkabacteria bacterium]
MRKVSKKSIVIVIVLLIGVFVTLFTSESIPQYSTTTLATQEIKRSIDFTAYWYPVSYTEIALGSSTDIKKVMVKAGDVVKKNQVLVELVNDVEWNQFKAAQAGYYAAIRAKRNAEAQVGTPQATLDSLQGQINAAYYQMKNTEVALQRKKITSPRAGKIISVTTKAYASPSASGLASVASTGNMIVMVDAQDKTFIAEVSERDVMRIEKEMEVEVQTRVSERILRGKVTAVSANPISKTTEDAKYRIEISFTEYPQEITFGSKLEGNIIVITKSVEQSLPYDAVTVQQDQTGTVLVLNEQGQAVDVAVLVGAVGDDAVEIISGISKEDKVIVDTLPDKRITTVRPWVKKLFQMN